MFFRSLLLAMSLSLTSLLPVLPALANPRSIKLLMSDGAVVSAAIQIQSVERPSKAPELRFPATVTIPANRIRAISAPVEGLVEELFALTDERIKAGQAVATVRSPGIIEAQRGFLASYDELRLSEDRLRRYESLVATRAIAERELREAEGAVSLAKSKLEERRYILHLMDMSEQDIEALQTSRKLVSFVTLKAPIEGTVIKRHVSPGERIPAATALYSVADLSKLFVNIQVPSHSINTLPANGTVLLPALGLSGKIVRAAPTINEATQSGTVVAEFENIDGRLKPGLTLTSVIQSGSKTTTWTAPLGAVVRHRERSWIFLRRVDGFEARSVQVVAENDRATFINAELVEGEQMAVRGTILLLGQLAAADGS